MHANRLLLNLFGLFQIKKFFVIAKIIKLRLFKISIKILRHRLTFIPKPLSRIFFNVIEPRCRIFVNSRLFENNLVIRFCIGLHFSQQSTYL